MQRFCCRILFVAVVISCIAGFMDQIAVCAAEKNKTEEDGKKKLVKEFQDKQAKLVRSNKKRNAEAWFELGNWASEKGLGEKANEMWEKVLTLNSKHEGAHKALGHEKFMGQWMTSKQIAKLKKPKKEKKKKDGSSEKEFLSPKEPPAKKIGWEWVKCTDCTGSGASDWLNCHQCSKHGNPGWVNTGSRLLKCQRCDGKGKVPGIRCMRCKGAGKVRSDAPPLAPTGRIIPKGYKLCGSCNGDGCKSWLTCNQCDNSRKPGYVDLGNYLQVCQRCKGKAKLPGVPCNKCHRSGIVRE